jgi:VanZ family protein
MQKINTVISILIALNIIFILYQAQLDGSQSSDASSQVVDIAEDVLEVVNIEVERDILHTFIRELAHVFQYFTLGILFLIRFLHKKYLLYLGGIVMVIDETIQYFTPGRAFELKDLGLDTIGFSLGILVVSTLLFMIKGRKVCAALWGMLVNNKQKTSS